MGVGRLHPMVDSRQEQKADRRVRLSNNYCTGASFVSADQATREKTGLCKDYLASRPEAPVR